MKKMDKGAIPGLSKNALTVLEKRYLKRDKDGKVLEKPADMFHRVAMAIAAADAKLNKNADTTALADKFYAMMTSFEFLPQLADPDERRTRTGAALRLLCPPRRRLHGRDLRGGQIYGTHP